MIGASMLPALPASILAMSDNFRLAGQNIGYLVDVLKLCTRADLADYIGISVAAVGQLIRGETKQPKPTNLAKAARKFGLMMEDLVSRDLRRENWRPEQQMRAAPGVRESAALIYLPVLSIAGSGGPGTEGEDLEIIDELAFKRSWIKKQGWEIAQLGLHDVVGNSMAHWMPHGNRALLHRGDNVIRETEDPYENVFGLMDGSGFRFKKIIQESDGSLILHSFNEDKKKYPDERRRGQEVESIMRGIIGRVVWRGG